MQVQEFINQNGIMALKEEPLNIKIRAYEDLNVYVLNYDQIKSSKTHPITIECRSLIVDKNGNVLSRSFDRFFNHGENPEFYHDFDLKRSVVYSKEDGSLTKLWFCKSTNQWEISTRSQAFAEGEHNMGGTFRKMILHAMKLSEEQFQKVMLEQGDQNLTYIAEYCSEYNRIVTPYKESKLFQLAVRNNLTGEYDNNNIDLLKSSMNIEQVKSWNLSTFAEIEEAAKNLPDLGEGYVCYDPLSQKRVKIKSPLYVHVHHLVDNGRVSLKALYLMVLGNETDEFLLHFPEHQKLVDPVKKQVTMLVNELNENWLKVKDIIDQKEFALQVKDLEGSGFYFTAKKIKSNPVSVFWNTDSNRLLKMFNIKEELIEDN